jgi:hypothetical protein
MIIAYWWPLLLHLAYKKNILLASFVKQAEQIVIKPFDQLQLARTMTIFSKTW